MSWIKFIFMIPAAFIIMMYTLFYYVFTLMVLVLIVITSVIVIISWKIPYLAGVRGESQLYFPFFFFNVFVILSSLVTLVLKIIW